MPNNDDLPLDEGRCARCRNWLKICGHDLPFKERIRSVNADTGWMPNAGSVSQAPFGADFRAGE